MVQVGDVSFVVDGKVVNKANARMRACDMARDIKRREDANLITRVNLGALLRGCQHAFGWKQCELASALCLHYNMVSRAMKLAAALDDGAGQVLAEGRVGPGRIDWARLDAIRLPATEAQEKAGEKGDLPCLTIAEDLLGVRTKPTRTNEAAKFSRREKDDRDTRDSGAQAGSSSGMPRTKWRQDSDAGTKHTRGGNNPPAERVSLSSPPPSGPGLGARALGAPGDDPEPPAGGGRASTGARRPAGMAAPRGVPGLATAGAAVGTPGGEQLTLDAMYAGAVSEAERLVAVLGELVERDGLDAGKVMAAQVCGNELLGYLREAGGPARGAGKGTNANTARRGKTPHGVPSRTTGAGRAG